ncbi:MAG TPA: FkbM family methyltransferase [Patescibacteria group bacterium]|nr:FkbM family methyltransferase [Patescibacteria group bacterium]
MNTLTKTLLAIKTIEDFPMAFMDRFKLVSGNKIYKIRNKKLKFEVRSGTEDLPEIIVVASGYEYDFDKIKLPKNPIIVDLGAHIGSFSVYVASILKNKCKIIAVEPDSQNFSLLKRNLSINKSHSVKPIKLAISDYKGEAHLRNENMNTDAYYLDVKNKNNSNCKVDTLVSVMDKMKIKRVDLLKLDVEGSEYEILQHKKTFAYIKKNVKYVFIEYHELTPGKRYKKIKSLIEDNFDILERHANILTLQNKKMKK